MILRKNVPSCYRMPEKKLIIFYQKPRKWPMKPLRNTTAGENIQNKRIQNEWKPNEVIFAAV